MSSSSAAISSACVHDVVSSACRAPVDLLEERLGAAGERAVAGDVAVGDRLGQVLELAAGQPRLVETDRRGGRHVVRSRTV